MAEKSKMRRRRGRIRRVGKVAAVGGGILKPGAGGVAKSPGRGNRRRGPRGCAGGFGNVVKPSDADSKPNYADSVEEAWIDVCGHRIEMGSLRIRVNSEGEVYVPDSEEEESGMEVEACGDDGVEMSTEGASRTDLAPLVAADGAACVDLAHTVATDGAAGEGMHPEIAARLAKKVLGEDLHPEVAARLAEVLSRMEPLYHELFIDMYKVMVPLFFTPARPTIMK